MLFAERVACRGSLVESVVEQLEQKPHLDRVPELAALAPVVLDAAAFLDEAVLAIEREPGGVVREDAEAQLVQSPPRAQSIAASISAEPTPRPRHSRAIAIPISP